MQTHRGHGMHYNNKLSQLKLHDLLIAQLAMFGCYRGSLFLQFGEAFCVFLLFCGVVFSWNRMESLHTFLNVKPEAV